MPPISSVQSKLSCRIGLIGPLLPFRGGIAQHTTRLHRALLEHTGAGDLKTFSFSRMYPRWLFPGESDRDPDHIDHREADVDYRIDSLNPLTWLSTLRSLKRCGCEAVVVPWWTVFWAPCFGYLAVHAKRMGMQVVFLCHNVVDHEAASWKKWLTRWVLKQADAYVVQSESEKARLCELMPALNASQVYVHLHPIYDQFPAPKNELARRSDLELLFYGFVRPYKGLDVLIDALAHVQRRDFSLTIAGEFWTDPAATIAALESLGLGDRIELRAQFSSEQDSAELFARADVVVLPYRSATGSGIVPMAYHYEKPVLASRVGGLVEVVEAGCTGWFVPPGDATALARAIDQLDRAQIDATREPIAQMRKRLSWDSFAACVARACELKA